MRRHTAARHHKEKYTSLRAVCREEGLYGRYRARRHTTFQVVCREEGFMRRYSAAWRHSMKGSNYQLTVNREQVARPKTAPEPVRAISVLMYHGTPQNAREILSVFFDKCGMVGGRIEFPHMEKGLQAEAPIKVTFWKNSEWPLSNDFCLQAGRGI
jgi:hypothetical protein